MQELFNKDYCLRLQITSIASFDISTLFDQIEAHIDGQYQVTQRDYLPIMSFIWIDFFLGHFRFKNFE